MGKVHRLVVKGNVDAVKQLLRLKPRCLDEKAEGGHTPLMVAITCGQMEMANFLLDFGADPNLSDEYGGTPLAEAAAKGFKGLVERLIASGADLNSEDVDGLTPLDWARIRDYDEVMTILKNHGGQEGGFSA